MYNYQTFLRQQSLKKFIQALKQEHKQTGLKREHSSPMLVQAHKKRIQGFVLAVIDKPVAVSQHKNHAPSFRNSCAEGMLGAKGMYLKRQSSCERTENQLKKNEILDQVPFNNTFSHKFRQSKGKGLHYRSYTHNLRIKEYLDRQDLNYLPNCTYKADKLLRKQKKGEKVDLQKLNTSLNKTLLPMLHQKTYFKSVSTLFTQIPTNTQQTEVLIVNEQGIQQVEESRNMKTMDFINRKQNSRDALIKCNMLRQKMRA